jgi:gliding motility-associated-like protein
VDLTSSVADSYQWLLNGVDIPGATGQTFPASQEGTYTVTTVIGACTSTSANFVLTAIVPTITGSGGATTLCPGGTLDLTSSPADSYLWFLNGVGIAGATNQVYTATQEGTYTVTTVLGPCTSGSVDFVLTYLTASISSAGGVTTFCSGSGLDLTSSLGTSYQWQLNGVNISGATNQVYTATSGGTYTVIVMDGPCSLTSSDFVLTEIIPVITSNTGANALCPGSNLILTSSLSDSYQWMLNGVDIPGATNQTYSATQGGVYSVTGVIGTCTSTSLDFVVTEIIPAITSAGGVITICPGSVVDLTSSISDSYQWSLDGVDIPGATNQTYTATVGGVYTVTAVIGSCSSTSADFILTEIIPTITGSGGASTLCPGSTLDLSSSAADSYQWALNGVDIPGATNQVYTATQEGTYSVTTVVGSCTSTSSDFIVTSDFPQAPVITLSDTSGCSPLALDLSHDLTGVSTQWFIDGSLVSTNQNFQGSISQVGCLDVELILTSTSGCDFISTLSNAICITPTPVASFTMNPNEISSDLESINFINSSQNATMYIWNFGNGNSSNAVNPSEVFSINETGYQITLTAINDLDCYDEYSILLNSNDNGTVYIPNAFTPDGDEHNQVFKPTLIPGFDLHSYKMQIFNRWGELIFVSQDLNFGWDGTSGMYGYKAMDGVYIWKISFKDQKTNERKELIGHVTLIR